MYLISRPDRGEPATVTYGPKLDIDVAFVPSVLLEVARSKKVDIVELLAGKTDISIYDQATAIAGDALMRSYLGVGDESVTKFTEKKAESQVDVTRFPKTHQAFLMAMNEIQDTIKNQYFNNSSNGVSTISDKFEVTFAKVEPASETYLIVLSYPEDAIQGKPNSMDEYEAYLMDRIKMVKDIITKVLLTAQLFTNKEEIARLDPAGLYTRYLQLLSVM